MNGLPLLVEAVREVREEGKDVVLAHGNGGVLSTQATVLLGSEGRRERAAAGQGVAVARAGRRGHGPPPAPGDHEGGAMSERRSETLDGTWREETQRSWWGWGFEDAKVDAASLAPVVRTCSGSRWRRGRGAGGVVLHLAARAALPRPDGIEGWSTDPRDRVEHAYGRSFPDTVRAFRGRVDHPPDAVVFASREEDVEATLEWAAREDVAVIPFGGGTSVVGGVEPRVPHDRLGVVSLDLSHMGQVLEVDPVSRAARVQAGVAGPALEAQLAEHGLTMRFFPQSFELSTLGGWIATRAGGHFATVWTHVDDLVESVRAITPSGAWASRRLPGSGAGPSPDRMLLGSEGILGVITEAWVRCSPSRRTARRAPCASRTS